MARHVVGLQNITNTSRVTQRCLRETLSNALKLLENCVRPTLYPSIPQEEVVRCHNVNMWQEEFLHAYVFAILKHNEIQLKKIAYISSEIPSSCR